MRRQIGSVTTGHSPGGPAAEAVKAAVHFHAGRAVIVEWTEMCIRDSMSTAPKPPAATCLIPKASSNILEKTDGIMPIFLIMIKMVMAKSVSYTHLDVYKRQSSYSLQDTKNFVFHELFLL